jgi:CheY-specific phosphatase CheX
MAIDTLEPRLLDRLQQAAREVLETMVALRPRAVSAGPETRSSFDDEVIGLVGFTGTRAGTFVARTREQVARDVAARMLMAGSAAAVTFGDARDAFGEVVNVVAGNFKNSWVAGGNRMELCVPNVIRNGRVRLRSDGDGCLRSRVRVHLDAGILDIGVHFEAVD